MLVSTAPPYLGDERVSTCARTRPTPPAAPAPAPIPASETKQGSDTRSKRWWNGISMSNSLFTSAIGTQHTSSKCRTGKMPPFRTRRLRYLPWDQGSNFRTDQFSNPDLPARIGRSQPRGRPPSAVAGGTQASRYQAPRRITAPVLPRQIGDSEATVGANLEASPASHLLFPFHLLSAQLHSPGNRTSLPPTSPTAWRIARTLRSQEPNLGKHPPNKPASTHRIPPPPWPIEQ